VVDLSVCFLCYGSCMLCFVKELDSIDVTEVDDGIATDSDDADEMSYEAAAASAEYMPVRQIVSDKERLKQSELQQNIYRPPPVVQIKTVPATVCSIPIHLTAYAFDLGDISSFPSPKKYDTNKLGWMLVGC